MSFARRMMITAHHSRVAQRVHSRVQPLETWPCYATLLPWYELTPELVEISLKIGSLLNLPEKDSATPTAVGLLHQRLQPQPAPSATPRPPPTLKPHPSLTLAVPPEFERYGHMVRVRAERAGEGDRRRSGSAMRTCPRC